MASYRRGEFNTALAAFETSATQNEEIQEHAHAAIAYRAASQAADRLGRTDRANHLLRLAGKHYLSSAEYHSSSFQSRSDGFTMAAKCFLHAGNLRLAAQALQRALDMDDSVGIAPKNKSAKIAPNSG